MVKVKVFDAKRLEGQPRSAAPAESFDPKVFHALVESRRSVRVYTDKPIPEEAVRRVLDSALKAATSSNLQTTEIHWVWNPEKRAQLVSACMGQPAAATAKELFVIVARPDLWKRNNDWMVAHLQSQPDTPERAIQYFTKITRLVYTMGPFGVLGPLKRVWFAIRGISQATPREPVSLADMRTWAHKTAALAAAHFMLGMRAEGFDTCPMEGMDSKRVKAILNLPRRAGITMVISAGERAEGGVYGPRFRFDKEHFLIEQS
jgi:nitroreductase